MVYNQQQEITFHSDPRDQVPCDGSEFPDNGLKAPRGKIKKIRLEAQHMLDHTNPSARSFSQLLGKLNATDTTDGSTVLLLTTVLLETSTRDQLSGLQLNCPVIPPGTRRSAVVRGPLIQVELEESDNSTIIYDDNVRCLSIGVGALCNEIWTRGPWSPYEQTLHINLPGAPGSDISHSNLYQGKSSITVILKLDNTTTVAYINRWGDSITYAIADDKGSVAMVH